jgi:hypothetical protein
MDSFTRRAHAMNENIRRSSAKKSTGTVEDQHTKWRYQKRSQQAPRCRDDFGVQVRKSVLIPVNTLAQRLRFRKRVLHRE